MFVFFPPHHAFNRGLFPVGSALEVAPASVSLIFLLIERCFIGEQSGNDRQTRWQTAHPVLSITRADAADVAVDLTRERNRNSLSSDDCSVMEGGTCCTVSISNEGAQEKKGGGV